jgi:hypothetical protein
VEYVAALFPPTVMAIGFTCLIVTMIRSQGGANKYKEDAAADALGGRMERPRIPGPQ